MIKIILITTRMFGMIVMKRTLKTILTMTTITKNKILWMISLTILKMHTMTMIYQQDLMKIIDSKNKSDFLIRASAMVIKRMPTTAK